MAAHHLRRVVCVAALFGMLGAAGAAQNPTPPAGGCTTPDPFVTLGGGMCVNGGWLPPGMLPPTPTPAPPVPTLPPSPACAMPDPFVSLGGGTCVNGGWLPPGMSPPGPPAPTPPPSPPGCATPNPFLSLPNLVGLCVNGGWILVEPFVTLSGMVYESTPMGPMPVSGAGIYFNGNADPPPSDNTTFDLVSDVNGAYVIDMFRGDIVGVSHPGYDLTLLEWCCPADEGLRGTLPVDLELRPSDPVAPCCTIRGRVVEWTGAGFSPVAGVDVELWENLNDWCGCDIQDMTSDGAGEFTSGVLDPSLPYAINTSVPGYSGGVATVNYDPLTSDVFVIIVIQRTS